MGKNFLRARDYESVDEKSLAILGYDLKNDQKKKIERLRVNTENTQPIGKKKKTRARIWSRPNHNVLNKKIFSHKSKMQKNYFPIRKFFYNTLE